MILKIILFIIGAYLLFGILYTFLSFFYLCKKYSIDDGKYNVYGFWVFLKYCILRWPFDIKFFIWPDECWIEVEDKDGKKHYIRDKGQTDE